MPFIAVERGNDKGKTIKVEVGKRYVFGRDPQATGITLSDSLCSRRHFQVLFGDDSARIEDLESTNGTFLNDAKVQAAPIKIGDKIQVGETILSFLSDQKEETRQGLVGKTLGGYKILERVGRGGMGTVFKANQLSLNRIVALKVLSSRLLKEPGWIERFKSEARAAGQLNHPNIVQVYDVGTERNMHFFSMEFMDGGSLQDQVGKDGKLSWEEALNVFIQTTNALVFAERKKIVHRDVKPDNLMLTSDGQAKLADLGLARSTDQGAISPEEGIFGTPHFISPEQAQGKRVDHRADLYSLGATMYRLLAGRTPFHGNNVNEVIKQQISAEPPPLDKDCPEAPDELLRLIFKLMRKKPSERHGSAEELARDLEAIRLKYHLKVHGAGGGKGVLVAVAVAVLAVAGVIAFALTRPVNDNGPPVGTGGTIGPPPTQTVIVADPDAPELKAEVAYGRVERQELRLGGIEATWKTRGAEWIALASSYDQVAKVHAGTAHAGKAEGRAEAIRAKLKELGDAETARFAAANRAWRTLKSNVLRLLDDKRYAEAQALVEAQSKKEAVTQAILLLPEAGRQVKAWLQRQSGQGSIQAQFTAAWQQVLSEVKRLADQEKFVEAVTALRAFLDLAVGDETTAQPYAIARDEVGAQVLDELRETYGDLLRGRLDADRLVYYRAYRGIRHQSDAGTFPSNPIFDFSFSEAADLIESLIDANGAGGLKTSLYRDRARRKAAQLRSIHGLMTTLAAKFHSGALLSKKLEFPATVVGGSEATLSINRKKNPVATTKGLEVIRHIRMHGVDASSPEFVPWAKFSAAELFEDVFLAGRRFTMTREDHAALARFLAETGSAEGLEEEIDAAEDALDADEKMALYAELNAMEDWQAVIERMRKQLPADWELAAGNFVKTHFASDYFVLVYGHNRPWQRMFSPDTIAAWLSTHLKALDPK